MGAVCDSTPMTSATVAPLVQRAQSGDTAAFEQLYREHVDRVFALCLRMSADPVRAEELTQDVFVRAWEKLGSFRGESAFGSWLHRLAVNVVLGSRRSAGRREARVSLAEDPEVFGAASNTADPGAKLDLERALRTLPPSSRIVFVLHEVEGYAHGEIAAMTGRAEGTCKALLHRARKQLKEVLAR